MSNLRISSGSLSVTLDDALAELARQAIENVAPGMLGLMEGAEKELLDNARARWPVAGSHTAHPGKSRDGLVAFTSITPAGDAIRVTVQNPVEYARFVKSTKNGLGGKSAMVELMRKPVQAKAKEIAPLVAARAAEILGGRS